MKQTTMTKKQDERKNGKIHKTKSTTTNEGKNGRKDGNKKETKKPRNEDRTNI